MKKSKVSVSTGRRLLSLFLALLMILSTFMMTGMSVFAETRASAGDDDSQSYTVEISSDEHGNVSFDDVKGSSKDFDVGDVVKVMLDPDEGYVAEEVTASFEEQGIEYELGINDDYVAFEMPASDVQLMAAFETYAASSDSSVFTSWSDFQNNLALSAFKHFRNIDSMSTSQLGYDGFAVTGNYSMTGSIGSSRNISEIRNKSLSCAGYVDYFYTYYLDYAGVDNPIGRASSPALAQAWANAGDAADVEYVSGSTLLSYVDGHGNVTNASKMGEIPVGSLVAYCDVAGNGNTCNHVAIYAGCYDGVAYITHFSGSSYPNPNCSPIFPVYGESGGQSIYRIYKLPTETPTVDLSIKKSSSNTDITDGNSSYSLDGTKFTLTNTTTNTAYGTKTISGVKGGTVKFTELDEGSYVLSETVPSGSNYNAISSSITFDVEKGAIKHVSKPSGVTLDSSNASDNAYTFEVKNPPKTTNASIQKRTLRDFECLVANNSAYTLQGAQFTLNPTQIDWQDIDALVDNGKLKKFTTDSNGNVSISGLPYGTYKLKEVKAPQGYYISEKLKNGITVTLGESATGNDYYKTSWSSTNNRTTITVYDPMLYDPIAAFLSKEDSEFGDISAGGASLAGAEYTVSIYDDPHGTLSDSDIKNGNTSGHTLLARFVMVTDESGRCYSDKGHIRKSGAYFKNGTYDDWFDDDDMLMYPISTIHVTETKAPEGYERKDVPTVVNVADDVLQFVECSNNSATIHYSLEVLATSASLSSFINDDNTLTTSTETVLYAGLSVTKADNQSHESWGQGDAELAATFKVYNASAHAVKYKDKTVQPNGYVCSITADKSNNYIASTGDMDLMYGEYRVVEDVASDDYNVNPYSVIVNVHPENIDEQGTIYPAATNAENPVKRAGVSVTKFTTDFLASLPEGDATLAGAEYSVYNKSKNPVYDPMNGGPYADGAKVVTITTNENGFATTGAAYLPMGTYSIKETKASQGYKLNTAWEKTFTVTAEGQVVAYNTIPTAAVDWNDNELDDRMASGEQVIRGGIRIYKSDKNRIDTSPSGDENKAQGDASLERACFVVFNRSANKVKVNGQEFAPGQICLTLYTNKDGVAQSAADALPYGTYEIVELAKENAKSAPEGYFIDPSWSATVYIREDGKIVDANSYANLPIREPIYRGGFKFLKIDAERNEAIPQGDAMLENALFSVTNISETDVYVDGKWYAPGQVCYTFRTDENGGFQSANDLLPYGSYRITETAPSTGYLLNEAYSIDFQVRENGKIYDLTGTPCGEDVIRGDVQIVKNDIELDKSEAIGGKDHGNNQQGADLNGIELAIVNKSEELVIVDDVRYEPDDVVKIIVTHWNDELNAYTAETTGRALPYGTYDIYEVQSMLSTDNDDKANEYYLRSDAVLTFQIREDGETVIVDTDGEPLIFRDQIVRGDIEFRKIADGTSARMNTAWVVTNNTTGERHVIVADKNGEFYSASNRVKHTTNTNCNDVFLDRIDAGERIAMSEFAQRNKQGVWFGLAEDGSVSEPDDDLCALPYGEYTISEIPTDSNEGFGLQEFIFYIYENEQVVDLGTITDDRIEINTELRDERTGQHFAYAQNKTVLNDTVTYAGLTIGKDFTARGRLVDIDTGAVVATASKDFKAKTGGKAVVAFKFDATELAGHTIVAFEDIIDKSTGYKVGSHADIEDEDQMMTFPEIGTSAQSDLTYDHDAPALDKIVITDTVDYNNLIPDKEYTLVGTLMNKTVNDNVINSKGENVTSTVKFIPDEPSGTVEVKFEFDATELAGQTVVAFETLEYKGDMLAVHTDINDEAQTIYIPKIGTTAVFEATGTDEGAPMTNAVIEDTVAYENLLAGKRYTVEGVLMDKDTNDILVDADGNKVTAQKTFVPSTSNGSIVVSFNFNATNMAGKTVVAFETLKRNDIVMAEHKDINDEGQTIHFPEIGTKANYMDSDIQEGLANEKAVITDHVSYKNLKAGSEYIMNGTLMDKATGSVILDKDGNPVTAETIFTPEKTEGMVDVVFEFDASLLAGHTVVAFESLDHNGIEVAIHTDITDKDQSVNFPKIGTILTEKETGYDEVMAGKDYTFTDTIAYENLTIGHEYDIMTVLVDKETGKEIAKSVETKFTPKTVNGTFTVDIPVSTKDMANKSIVAYETISYHDIVVAEHKDIDDVDQTVTVPEIGTTAVSTLTGDNEGIVANDYQLTDTVEYKNLVPGRSYMFTGVIMDKETGEPAVGSDGNEIVVKQGFMAEAINGTVDVQFVFDSVPFAGKDIVVFETLDRDGVVLAEHKDINDEGQTIHFPEIGTSAFYGETIINEGPAGETVTIKDTVAYKNLRAGEEYTVVGKLMDKATGEPVLVETVDADVNVSENEDGTISADASVSAETKFVTAETKFTPKESDGSVDVVFEFDATAYAGKTVVAFESLVRGDVERTNHQDITDEAQSVYFPEIGTTLVNAESGLHESLATADTTLVDTVDYKNLIPGNTYTVTGTLMDKETGKAALDNDGKEITAEAEFTPETADGSVSLEFKFDATAFAGKTVVAFETVSRDGFTVATHMDIEDESQTVYFPKIGTEAVDIATNTHMLADGETVAIVDTVSYDNLQVGQEYTVIGTLMDKETGKAVELDAAKVDEDSNVVTASAVFKPEETSGTTTVTFIVPNKDFAGKTFVVFEKVFVGDTPVAVHEDIEDEAQTVHMMSLATKATGKDGRSKTIDISEKAVVVDTIEYKNLVPGSEYTIHGKLVYQDTQKTVKNSEGADAAVSAKFTPNKPDGSVNVEFVADTRKANGKTLVVFEKIYDNNIQIGSHEDINDKDQSVTVKTVTKLQTGIMNNATIVAIVMLVVLVCAIAFVVYKKRKADQNLINGVGNN